MTQTIIRHSGMPCQCTADCTDPIEPHRGPQRSLNLGIITCKSHRDYDSGSEWRNWGFLLLHQLLPLLEDRLQPWLTCVCGAYTVSFTVVSCQGLSRAAGIWWHIFLLKKTTKQKIRNVNIFSFTVALRKQRFSIFSHGWGGGVCVCKFYHHNNLIFYSKALWEK